MRRRHVGRKPVDAWVRRLADLLCDIDSSDEMAQVLTLLLSKEELYRIPQRIGIATMLLNGGTYSEIQHRLGTSTYKINWVKREVLDKWLFRPDSDQKI